MARTFTPHLPADNDLEYRGLVLDNGLVVLLVRNPTDKEQSSAALSVARGHMANPRHCMGMAHFCEHMLFLGNEAYPTEGAYRRYIHEHGGKCNASTNADTTTYKFTIAEEHFEGALDRFLNNFIAPLFTESATLRELNAVDAEYRKNKLPDRSRKFYLQKHLANPDHNYAIFGSGNLKSLLHDPQAQGIDTRTELLAWYAAHYSADIMSLVLRSTLPLDTMEAWVRTRAAPIPAKGMRRSVQWDGRHFAAAQLGRIAYYRPLGERRDVDIIIPYTRVADRHCSARAVVLYILGFKGEGSLSGVLRERGWATDLTVSESVYDNFGHMSVHCVLTRAGVDHVPTIVGEVVRCARMLETRVGGGGGGGVEEDGVSIADVWESRRRTMRLRFDYESRAASYDSVVALARRLRYLDATPEGCIANGRLWTAFDPAGVRDTLAAVRADNMLVLVTHPNPEQHAPLEEEPWWGVEFATRPWGDAARAAMAGASGDFGLPAANVYIPGDLSLRYGERHNDTDGAAGAGAGAGARADGTALPRHPTVVYESPLARVWWKGDATFRKPKLVLYAGLKCPLVNEGAREHCCAVLFSGAVDVALAERFAGVDTASWGFHTHFKGDGFTLTVKGFSDKLPLLFHDLLDAIVSGPITPEGTFDMLKERQLRAIANKTKRNSLEIAFAHLNEAVTANKITGDAADVAMRGVTYVEYTRFVTTFRAAVTAELCVCGNATRDEAVGVGTAITSLLSRAHDAGVAALYRPCPRRVVDLSASSVEEHRIAAHTPNPTNKDSAVVLHYQLGQDTPTLRATAYVLSQLLSPRFFAELRTKQQLGYRVSGGKHTELNELSFRFKIQCGVRAPGEVHRRVDVFLEEFAGELEATTEEKVAATVAAATQALSVPPHDLSEEFARHLEEIQSGRHCWSRRADLVAAVAAVAKSDLLALFRTRLLPHPAAPNRRRLIAAYHYCDAHAPKGDGHTAPTTTDARSSRVITDVAGWQHTLPLMPPWCV